jgi:hypothetical protein
VSFAKTASGGAAFSASTASGAPAGSGNQLPGGFGGAIGAVGAISDTGPASASVRATGGGGGAGVGFLNAPGSDGPSVTLFNAASGATAGQLTLTQTAVGGGGGNTSVGGAPGAGGNASSTLSFTSGASFIAATASATGGVGGQENGGRNFNAGGSAAANVAVTTTNPSSGVQARAIAASGVSLGGALPASASAKIFGAASGQAQSTSSTSSSKGQITTIATAFVGGPAIAVTSTSVNSPLSPPLPAITAGEAFAAGVLLPSASSAFGGLAMSAGYGGEGESLTYTSSATFGFTDPLTGDFKLTLLSSESSGLGFSDLTFDVRINSADHSFEFNTLSDADTFFTDNLLDFGDIAGGVKKMSRSPMN